MSTIKNSPAYLGRSYSLKGLRIGYAEVNDTALGMACHSHNVFAITP